MRKSLVTLVALALLPLSQISANASTFTFFSNTNLTDLDPNNTGYNFNGTFTKFPTKAGMYIQQCIEPVGNARPATCSDTNQVWVTEEGGTGRTSWKSSISMKLTSSITGKGVKIDCTQVQCGLFLRLDHTAPTDTSEDTFLKISFRSKNPAPQEKSPTPVASNTDKVTDSSKLLPTPSITDPYLPILKYLKISPNLSAKLLDDGRMVFPAVATVSMKIKYHKNPLAGFKISLRRTANQNATDCSGLGPVLSFPQDLNLEKVGNRKLVGGLKNRVQIGDWYEDTFEVQVPAYSNEYLTPCSEDYQVSSIELHDISDKVKFIFYRYGGNPNWNFVLGRDNFSGMPTKFSSEPKLPESACPKINVNGTEFPNSLTLCEDSADLYNAGFQVNSYLVATSKDKAAADKAAADKAAADKAAADKAAADKAAADKAAAKPPMKQSKITCTKGKSSLMVIGKNPKCPAGYKVKK